jgi:DNA-binding transcriptional LysR family regulator
MDYRVLRDRSVDLLLGRISTPVAEDDLEAEILFDEQIVVAAGTQSPWARSRRLELVDLANELWILPPADTLVGALSAEVFRASGLALPRAPVTTLSINLCCRLLATGRFVATLPASMLHFSARDLSLKVLPIKIPIEPQPVGILILKNRTLSPVAQLFIECAREVAKPLANRRQRKSRPDDR